MLVIKEEKISKDSSEEKSAVITGTPKRPAKNIGGANEGLGNINLKRAHYIGQWATA
jgi:hypothetical protein